MISPQSSKSIRSTGHHIISPSLHTGALHPVLCSLLPSPSLHTRGSWPCPYFYASISQPFISETLDPAHSSILSSSLPSYKRLLTLPLKFQASIIQDYLALGHSSLLPSPCLHTKGPSPCLLFHVYISLPWYKGSWPNPQLNVYFSLSVLPSTYPIGNTGSGYPLVSMIVIGPCFLYKTKHGAVLCMMFIDLPDGCDMWFCGSKYLEYNSNLRTENNTE